MVFGLDELTSSETRAPRGLPWFRSPGPLHCRNPLESIEVILELGMRAHLGGGPEDGHHPRGVQLEPGGIFVDPRIEEDLQGEEQHFHLLARQVLALAGIFYGEPP